MLIHEQFVDIAFGNNGDLTMSGIKRGNSGTRELNNQDGKKNEEEIARYVCSRFWNGTKFINVCGVCLVKISYKLAES